MNGGTTFWAGLARVRDELTGGVPASSPITGVVGPLAAALPVVRRLQRHAGHCEVAVLTPRAEIVCEPNWDLVRSGARLAEAAHRPGPTLLVIDASARLPLWVGPLVERLRRAGMGLVHYAVDGTPDDEILAAAGLVLGSPLTIDLASPVEPARLVELIDRGQPLASVRGVPLTAELVTAARRSCGGS